MKDLAMDLIQERLDFAIELIKEMCKKHKLELSDALILENARNVAISLYIARERYNERKR